MSIRADVQYYFEKHPNEKIYLKDLVDELSLESRQLQSAVYQLYKNGLELEIVHQGQCWIYKPKDSGNDPTFKVLGEGTDKTVLMDSEGNIWIARKVEL
jgi:hypothetical protein